MRRTVFALALLTLLASLLVADATTAAPDTEVVVALASPALAFAPGERERLDAEQQAFRSALRRELPDARVRWRYRLVANGFAVVLAQSDLPRLRTLPGVRDVFEGGVYAPALDQTPRQIGAPSVWSTGLTTAGQSVKIGIIDTGVDPSHFFFDPKGYTMPAGFPKGQTRYTTAKVIVARAFAPRTTTSKAAKLAFDGDFSDHGTHVAGIAAGNAQTRVSENRVVSGVAPRAYVGNYRALVRTDSGLSPNGNAPEIVAAIEAAVRDGMDVINLSLGEPEIEPSRDVVALALDAAAAAGVVPVVAAGNDFNEAGAGSVSSPANSAAAISVGAVAISPSSERAVHAEFSSVGPTTVSLRLKPDVVAPGVDVFSSVPGGWAAWSGTSMAAPHVAGAAALLKQRHPGWSSAQIKSALVQTAGSSGAVAAEDQVALPTFVGGGLVSLPHADRPLVFAQPATVSLGLIDGRDYTIAGKVSLADAGGGAGAWEARVDLLRAPEGATVTLPGPSVSVPGELAYEISVLAGAAEGDVTGYLTLHRGADVRRIPFWGRVTAPKLGQHTVLPLAKPGVFKGSTLGRPSLVMRYRYPESPEGLGITTVLRGPEAVYRVRVTSRIANFGVVVTSQAKGARVEPRVVAGLDENRLTGYAGLPVAHNPYLEGGFREPVPVAAALSPRRGEYAVVFDSATAARAGRFTFRFWVNDLKPPTLKLRSRTVKRGAKLLVAASDAGSGVFPGSVRATIDGSLVRATYRRGVVRVDVSGFEPGRYRLRLHVSDYQETKNTENVARVLPNTRVLTTTFRIAGSS